MKEGDKAEGVRKDMCEGKTCWSCEGLFTHREAEASLKRFRAEIIFAHPSRTAGAGWRRDSSEIAITGKAKI